MFWMPCTSCSMFCLSVFSKTRVLIQSLDNLYVSSVTLDKHIITVSAPEVLISADQYYRLI